MFILCLGFFVYQFFITNYDQFGIHFRFLTVWALTGALIISGLLLTERIRGNIEKYHALSSIVSVLNAVVVFLYWKFFSIDPALINAESIPWYQEYYLHVLGPFLVILDAIIINKSFQKHKQAIAGIILICILYVVWLEYIVSPLNELPLGSFAQGLPYPFLNDLQIKQRSIFYGTTIVIAVGFYLIGCILMLIYSQIIKRR